MSHSFSILHISDLHERGPREPEAARRERVLGEAWLQNLDELRAEGVDLVCMTGDLAQSGKRDEYDRAGDFLDRTLKQLGIGRQQLFIVPGNHDINRDRSISAWRELRTNIHRADRLEVARWLAGGRTPLGMETAWRNGVFRRQEEFRAWLKSFGLSAQLPGASPHGKLGYRARISLPKMPFDCFVIGLDSAWLAGSDDDAGNLRLTDTQVDKLCTDERGKALAGFRLVLIHHPLTELFDGAECRRLLAGTTDLLLRGHVHDPEPELWADPDRKLRQFAAGCLFEGSRADRHPNGCTLIRVTCNEAGRPERYELRFRSYSPRGGHWHDDNSLYRAAQNGRLTIDLTAPSEPQTSIPQRRHPDSPGSTSATDPEREGSGAKQVQHIDSLNISGNHNTVVVQQIASDGPTPSLATARTIEPAHPSSTAPHAAEAYIEQQYRLALVDTYARTSPAAFLKWRHGQRAQHPSRLELFVAQKVRRLKDVQSAAAADFRSQATRYGQQPAQPDSELATYERVLSQHRFCLLLGVPGAGKSELTRWLALRMSTEAHYPQCLPSGLLPVRIELRELDDEDFKYGNLLGGILGYLKKKLDALSLAVADSIRTLAMQGRLFFLFDGMDEVRLPARRSRLAEMIRTLYRTTPCRVIVTSRSALESELVSSLSPALSNEVDVADEFAAYYLEPFDDLQIAQYLTQWHQKIISEDLAQRIERQERLRRSLEESRPLRELATNPLLLALLCALNYRRELPRRRHQIFAEAASLMIHEWDAQKSLSRREHEPSISDDEKHRFLEELAWGMHLGQGPRGGTNRIQREDLFQFALRFWRHLPLGEIELERRTDELLRDLEQQDHLLSHLGADLFGFMNQSFLEYLAACHAVRNLDGSQLSALFRKHGFNEGWLEVFTLCCGLLDDEGKAKEIKTCLQDLLREVPLRFQDREQRMAYAAVAIRCLAEVSNPEAEPFRSLAELVRQLLQSDALTIRRRGFGAWRDREVITALHYYGPRWPSLEAWTSWMLQPLWQQEGHFSGEWHAWGMRCVLAATPVSRRVPTLIMLLGHETNLHVIAGALEEATLLGPWTVEEAAELAQTSNQELLIRIGLELASSGKPEVLVALLRRPVDDWICLYIARDNSASQDEALGTEAWRALFRLTTSANDQIRFFAVNWLAPARNELEVRQRFLELAQNDPAERVRFKAAQVLFGTVEEPAGLATLIQLLNTKDTTLLDWLATALGQLPDQSDRRCQLLLRLLDSAEGYSRSRAAADLAESFLDRKEVENRLLLHLEAHPQDVRRGDGLHSTFLVNPRLFDATLRALYAADYFDSFNRGLLVLAGTFQRQPVVAAIVEKLKAELEKPLTERARLYIAMWLHQHGLAKSEALPHLKRLADEAQDEQVRMQAAGLLSLDGAEQLYSLVVHAKDKAVRSQAMWALLRHSTDRRVQGWLLDLVRCSSYSSVRIRAAMALYGMEDPALRETGRAAILALANGDEMDEEVRLEAAEELVLRPVLAQLAACVKEEKFRLRAQDSIDVLSLRDQILSL